MEVKKSPTPKKDEGLEKKDDIHASNLLYLESKYLSEILKDLGISNVSDLQRLDIKSKRDLEKRFNYKIKTEEKLLSKEKMEIDRLIKLFKQNLENQKQLYEFSKKTAKVGRVKSSRNRG